MDVGVTPRRHNPVDSICRKLQTIQRRDQEINSPFQIPKFQTNSYDSPHSGLRFNLEAILKKHTVRPDDSDSASSAGMLTPTASPGPGSSCNTPRAPITPVNATYSITSTLGTLGTIGDRRTSGTYSRPFRRNCSTPSAQTGDNYFNFTPRYSTQSQGPDTDVRTSKIPTPGLFSYNLNFSSDISNMDSELAYPALVVKRLSLGEGSLFTSEPKKESMAEVSLICEEDLLDTIFQACDTQCRGKVYVSHIVDFLRHTTCRSSEDSGLEELCNMLDPERKDISIDLDTYHAIMKEWIEDCRNQGKDLKNDTQQESSKLRDSLSAKRSALLNMTSGSLEAFGGEASRADLETSDLVFCVADLQLNNQKLQEEVRKLKQAVENMEDTNQKLIEENEELKTQAKMGQQLLQKEKMLKEEVEEMKLSLTSSEESRAQAAAQRKQMERENQSLISKIAALQEENMKVTLEAEELQKKMNDLCDLNADLQVQIHSFDAILADKESLIQEKNKQMDELKVAVVEYSSVTELLRADKNKLESQMQMMQPDVTIPGLSLSVAYRLNQTSSGSLQTELALAQNPLEGLEHLSTSVCFASSLDETLDREVLLLLQGPTPEQLSLEFKSLISRLKREFKEDGLTFLTAIRSLTENSETQEANTDLKMQGLEVQLEQRRTDWIRSLEQLDQYRDSLERELLKMASNMRRSRTEILHLSVKVQEQENQKQQLREEVDRLKTPLDNREASSQTPDHLQQVVEELDGPSLEWDEEYVLSESPPLQELGPDQQMLEELCCDEEVLQALKQEEEEPTETVSDKEKITAKSEGEGEATYDSGVENEEPQRDFTLSHMCLPDKKSERESNEAPFVGEGGEQRPCMSLKEEDRLPECTGPEDAHEQAAPLPHTHCECAGDQPLTYDNLEVTSVKDHILSTEPSSLMTCELVSPSTGHPEVGNSITGRTEQLVGTNGEPEEERLTTGADMSDLQRLGEGQLSKVSAKSDKSLLLPVAEEEEAMPEAVEVTSAGVNSPDKHKTGSKKTVVTSDSNSTGSADSLKDPSEKVKDMTFDPAASEDNIPTVPATQSPKKDPLASRNKLKKEMSSMEVIEEQKAQEDGEPTVVTEKEGDTSVSSENASDSTKDDKNSLSPSDKEIEAEFHRLSLGFKCDMFTLEKRLRLEERSRDLAEENVRKEVISCKALLQALIPRCEEDNQSMEIIHRVQKNLEILVQSMTRVSSRSEMLGAIHQETRVGKTVEVMIQHVENLRRMYTKEHAELLELRENLTPNERSFGSHSERDDFRNKKQTTSNIFKTTSRRISIATIPRSIGGQTHFDMPKDMAETEVERLSRRSPWNMAAKRPPLKRFVSSGTWADIDEPTLMNSPTPSPTDNAPPSLMEGRPAVSRGARGIWIWVALFVVLAVLLALLASLMLQPAVDAAPVGTGDSWMTIQQLLWPYTGLRHNGQPPV
ncbi:inositol 1,4,5-triphosphate receptor associated 2 isoform X3 [Danio rerio]|uniref:Inositol 1,4,5-triphosphate receptor associated 2 n=2 Tax=Danio rerio TaxID=7955 RepID=IRAG2_DANRE|nr:inositol 1,4,5-triphosphate receptor associated 2 isoform 1 [Danio rerio]XP_009298592.1 lymphoid-restricted membrane protein isoform X3 [Danio rerio]Q5RHB5.2 RecName: Full=Inositol 1,4,5-triphosphate receptor associated 2; AltName: Full=Lymphoid-restricted membrane protein [Danio rerio]AFS18273.1 lymphoid-restricted membrane protein maternal long form [Danio rerio]|eukprot:NP_001333213.1 lymphoid-restricted membrane protein isoform 1 [Danio rerio]